MGWAVLSSLTAWDPSVHPHGCFGKCHLYLCNISTLRAAVTGLAVQKALGWHREGGRDARQHADLNKATEGGAGSLQTAEVLF